MGSLPYLLLVLLLVLPPLLSALIATPPLAQQLHWPPVATQLPSPPFSLALFSLIVVVGLVALLPLIGRVRPGSQGSGSVAVAPRPMPGWGWASLPLIALSFLIVHNGSAAIDPFRPLLLFPCGIAISILVNALVWRRTGHSLLTDQPLYFALLIAVSVVLGLYIEYLNLFVANWYYRGAVSESNWWWLLTGLTHAALLPLVASIRQWLSGGLFRGASADQSRKSTAAERAGLERLLQWGAPWLIICGLLLLAAAVSWGEALYPLVWLAPLLIVTGWQSLAGGGTLLRRPWIRVAVAAVSGLLYGVIAEILNQAAQLQRVYHLPHLDCCSLLSLPLAGWVAYLLLGISAAAVIDLLAAPMRQPTNKTPPPRQFPVNVVVEGAEGAGQSQAER
jgi:hypothetical protein